MPAWWPLVGVVVGVVVGVEVRAASAVMERTVRIRER
jgi:hypothetical protein